MANLSDDRIAPVHESNLFVLRKVLGVYLFDEYFITVRYFLRSDFRILPVFRFVFGVGRKSSPFHAGCNIAVFVDGCMSWGNRIDEFFVCCPKCSPVKVDDVAAWTLLEDEFSQGRNSHSSPSYPTNRWKARIIPAPYHSLVHKFC